MGFTKAASLLLKARDALVQLKADSAATHVKLASAETELKAYLAVLELVKEGLIDPIDVFDKLAEFKEDPNKPVLLKQAAQMGYSSQNYSIGYVTDLGKQASDTATPEERLVERVRDIVEDY
jgi:hypothetical protein